MFDQTFVDRSGKTNKSWTVAFSFGAEFAAVGVMILVPLIWTEVLPKAQLINSLLAPAPPPPPAPAPPLRPAQPHPAAPRQFDFQALAAPHTIPQEVAIVVEDAPFVAEPGLGRVLVPSLNAITGVAAAPVSVAPPPVLSAPKVDAQPRPPQGPLTVGGNVQAAKLIKHPTPVYPPIAKSARIQGTVILQATIGKDGTVQNLTVVSAASPLLVQAAKDAVKQWVYQPTLLNGLPVEVITEIIVNFALQ